MATNINPISGGTERKVEKIITAEDIKDAEEIAKNEFNERTLERLKNLPNTTNFFFIENTLKTEITSINPDKKENDLGDLVNVEVSGTGEIEVFDKTKIEERANEVFANLKPEGYKESNLVFNTKTWEISEEKGGIITIKTNADISYIPDFNFDEIKSKIANVQIDKAPSVLKDFKFVLDVRTSYFPDSYIPNFLRYVPDEPDRIEIRIEAKEEQRLIN